MRRAAAVPSAARGRLPDVPARGDASPAVGDAWRSSGKYRKPIFWRNGRRRRLKPDAPRRQNEIQRRFILTPDASRGPVRRRIRRGAASSPPPAAGYAAPSPSPRRDATQHRQARTRHRLRRFDGEPLSRPAASSFFSIRTWFSPIVRNRVLRLPRHVEASEL